ncbi:hypothetical protein MKX08_000831 [Trichoderma sp. CBMAI-0020]|nr:hypothetical protein MKX08_000831 [Trichoderma sp. CBMAI-0020]
MQILCVTVWPETAARSAQWFMIIGRGGCFARHQKLPFGASAASLGGQTRVREEGFPVRVSGQALGVSSPPEPQTLTLEGSPAVQYLVQCPWEEAIALFSAVLMPPPASHRTPAAFSLRKRGHAAEKAFLGQASATSAQQEAGNWKPLQTRLNICLLRISVKLPMGASSLPRRPRSDESRPASGFSKDGGFGHDAVAATSRTSAGGALQMIM